MALLCVTFFLVICWAAARLRLTSRSTFSAKYSRRRFEEQPGRFLDFGNDWLSFFTWEMRSTHVHSMLSNENDEISCTDANNFCRLSLENLESGQRLSIQSSPFRVRIAKANEPGLHAHRKGQIRKIDVDMIFRKKKWTAVIEKNKAQMQRTCFCKEKTSLHLLLPEFLFNPSFFYRHTKVLELELLTIPKQKNSGVSGEKNSARILNEL